MRRITHTKFVARAFLVLALLAGLGGPVAPVGAVGTCTITVDIPDVLNPLGAKIDYYPWSRYRTDGQTFTANQGSTVTWIFIVNGFSGKTFNFIVPLTDTATLTVGSDAYCTMKVQMPDEVANAGGKVNVYPWNTYWTNNQEIVVPIGGSCTWRLIASGFTGKNTYIKNFDCTALVVDSSHYCIMEVQIPAEVVSAGGKVVYYPYSGASTTWYNGNKVTVPVSGSCKWKLTVNGFTGSEYTKNFDCTALVVNGSHYCNVKNNTGIVIYISGYGNVAAGGSVLFPMGTKISWKPIGGSYTNKLIDCTPIGEAPVNQPPTANAGGPYSVAEGASVQLNGSGTDPEAGPITYAWDLDNNGTFETPEQNVMFSAVGLDGPSSKTVVLRVTDNQGATATSSTVVNITNVAPTIALSGTDVSEGTPYELTLGPITDPGVDTVNSYKITWGDGNSDTFSGTPSGVKTHTYADGPNSYTIEVDLTDEDGIFLSAGTKDVQIANVAPIIELIGTDKVDEGSPYSLTLGPITDPGVDTVSSYQINWGDGNSETLSGIPSGVKTHTYADGLSDYDTAVDLTDEDGTFPAAGTKALTVNNVAPAIVSLTATSPINENESTTLSGSFTDPGILDSHTVIIDWGDGTASTTLNLAANVLTFSTSHTYIDDDPTLTSSDVNTISVTIIDKDKGSASGNTTITVNNVPPTLDVPTLSPVSTLGGNVYPVNTPLTLAGLFTDPGTLDNFSLAINWDDATTPPPPISLGTVHSYSVSKTYGAAGVYSVEVSVTDDDTGVSNMQIIQIVIYDPGAGFVTGGGWINSPTGAYTPDPNLSGKATFGFVSKYQKGANVPTGQTEFQFHVANFNFHSESYQWLVVSGYSKAQYKGDGKVNGVPGFGFLLTAYDGTPDKFRIKIWNSGGVVYDNAKGKSDDIDKAEPMEISGGSIVIHTGKK